MEWGDSRMSRGMISLWKIEFVVVVYVCLLVVCVIHTNAPESLTTGEKVYKKSVIYHGKHLVSFVRGHCFECKVNLTRE